MSNTFTTVELKSSIAQYKELGMTMLEPTVELTHKQVLNVINQEWKENGYFSEIVSVKLNDQGLVEATDQNGFISTWSLYESWGCDGLICAEPYDNLPTRKQLFNHHKEKTDQLLVMETLNSSNGHVMVTAERTGYVQYVVSAKTKTTKRISLNSINQLIAAGAPYDEAVNLAWDESEEPVIEDEESEHELNYDYAELIHDEILSFDDDAELIDDGSSPATTSFIQLHLPL